MNRQPIVNESPEPEIDAALRVLSDCRVPVGMPDRIQKRLRAAADLRQADARRWLRVPAAAGLATIVLIAVFLSIHSGPSGNAPVAQSPSPGSMEKSSNRPAAPMQLARAEYSEGGQVLKTARHHGRTVVRHHAARLFDYPLTKQERLLVQFARTASPAELQILNPQYQAKVEAQQEAEFAAYIHSADESGAKETQVAANRQTTQE